MTTLRDAFFAAQAAREVAEEAIKEAKEEQAAAAEAEAEALDDYRDSDEPRTWEFWGNGGEGHDDVECSPSELRLGEIVRDGSWDVDPESGSIAVMIYARCVDTGEEYSRLVVIDPDEPKCCGGHLEHDWSDDYDLVGGCESNPGVWGHGAGTKSVRVCVHCGMAYISTSCSQGDGAETEHDYDSVRYSTDTDDHAVDCDDLAEYHQGDPPEAVLEHREDSADCEVLIRACLRWRADREEGSE